MTEVYDWYDSLEEKGTSFMIFPNEAVRLLDIMEGLNASGSRRDLDELKGIMKVLGLFNISEEMLKKVAKQ